MILDMIAWLGIAWYRSQTKGIFKRIMGRGMICMGGSCVCFFPAPKQLGLELMMGLD